MFSASLAGLMLGALLFGWLGDRWGRKRTIILAMLGFGVFAFATTFVSGLQQLTVLRFLTGLGLGGALPNLVALATDYMPARTRAIPACLISAAMPAGGMLAGFVASLLLPEWGWRWMFYIGGVLPVIVALALCFTLPESIRFLYLQPERQSQARAILRRLWPEAGEIDVRFGAATAQRKRARRSWSYFAMGARASPWRCGSRVS
jgi:AAHS family 4-hydroxybenzoate transporter-like MFS transporter